MQAINCTNVTPTTSLVSVAYRSTSEGVSQPVVHGQSGVAGYWLTGITAVAAVLAINSADLPTVPKDMSVTSRVQSPVALSPSLVQQREAALKEMLDYRDLEEGWDGTESVPPNPGVVDTAVAFLLAIPQSVTPPDATVSADGSVGWFWKSSETSISIQFSEGSYFAYYAKSKAKNLVARGEAIFDGKSVPDDLLQVMYLV